MRTIARVKTRQQARVRARIDEQMLKVGFNALVISSCAIGLWSAACLVGGVVASGGPLQLAAGLVKAIAG